jgi:hypothetical protein
MGSKNKFLAWKERANRMQKAILEDEESIKWWDENHSKVYDKRIEYSITDPLPLIENTNHKNEFITACNVGLLNAIDRDKEFVDTLVEVYWYNKDPESYPTHMDITLSERQLLIIEYRYLENKKTYEVCELIEKGYKPNAMYQALHKMKAKILRKLDEIKNKNIT